MRHDKIDTVISIEREKLIRKTWLIETVLDFLTSSAIILPFPIISTVLFVSQIKNAGLYIVGSFTFFIVSIIIGGLLFYSTINLNKLKRIKGGLKKQNRNGIMKLSEKLGWEILQHNEKLAVLKPSWSLGSLDWGQQIIVLYNRQDILINSTTYGAYDIKSPFHWFVNRKNEKKLKLQFQAEIESLANK